MMNRFADHAGELKTSFKDMDGSILHISRTMTDNSGSITQIADYTADFADTLHGIDTEISSCRTISIQLKDNLSAFHHTND